MRDTARLIALVLVLLLARPPVSGAYSYGAAESEPIVDAYTAAVAAAGKGDWAAAADSYATVRAEVEKDAGGPAATAAWNAAVAAKSPDAAGAVFRAIVFLNLQRRLTFGRQAIGDYATAKVLVNRATATYEALSPLVKAKGAKLDASVRTHLDDVFDSLGNPGVLGVGAKAPKPEAYDKAVESIVNSLRPLFPTDFALLSNLQASAGGTSQPAGSGNTAPKTEPAPVQAPKTDPAPAQAASAGSTAPSGTAAGSGTAPQAPAQGSVPASGSAPASGFAPAAASPSTPASPAAAGQNPPADPTQAPPAIPGWVLLALGAAGAAAAATLILRLRGRKSA